MQSLSLAMEQTQDKNKYTVIGWIKTKHLPTASTYLFPGLREKYKLKKRLEIRNGVFYRKSSEDTGQRCQRQYNLTRVEVVFKKHNSKSSLHLGFTKTAQTFREGFFFLTFVEHLEK